jgi:hypothetical protein
MDVDEGSADVDEIAPERRPLHSHTKRRTDIALEDSVPWTLESRVQSICLDLMVSTMRLVIDS